MNRRTFGKVACGAVWGTAAAVSAIGCNPLSLAAFLFSRGEVEPAKYPLTFGKDSPKKDKDEIVVALLTRWSVAGPSRDYMTADRDLAEKLAKVLPELAKGNKDKKKIRVISPTQVDKFKVANPQWHESMNAGEIGAKLDADFVLEIEIAHVQLYQPNTPATERIYEGHADVSVNIYEVNKPNSELKDHYSFAFSYPNGPAMLRTSSMVSLGEFKQQYIEGLATKIAYQHIDQKKEIGAEK